MPISVRRLAGLGIAVALCAHLGFLFAQDTDILPIWVGELTRFVPFYWMALLLGVSLCCSLFLRPVFWLIAFGNLALFIFYTLGFHWDFHKNPVPTGTSVRLLTFNIKALGAWKTSGGIEGMEQAVQQYGADIVALQDAQNWLTQDDDRTTSPQPVTRTSFGLPYVVAFGQYVLASRFPLTDCAVGSLGLVTPSNGYQLCSAAQYLQCTAHIASHQVQLVTAHLASPRNALMDTRHNFPSGLQSWQIHVDQRLAQSQALAADLSQMATPLIVMGDLNTAERSPVFIHLQKTGLRDAFSDAGQGWGYTHGHALSRGMDLYRIDHILVSPTILLKKAEVGSISGSEHNPVIADVYIAP